MSNYKTRMINGKKCIPKEEFCKQFICTESEMRRFIAQGMPHHKTETGTKLWFDVKECHEWFSHGRFDSLSTYTKQMKRVEMRKVLMNFEEKKKSLALLQQSKARA